MEWVIMDDGTDPIGDLVKDIPFVKYIQLTTKHALGKKRNLMHSHCTGDILVYMDDDDYYPPTRVSHAVERLTSSDALIAGSSIIHVYYPHLDKVIEFGPYGDNHATAGTFAFKRELLELTSYDDKASFAEEAHFLKQYTIPMVQLDPLQVILVVPHGLNTVDKKKVLVDGNPHLHETSLTMADFIKEPLLYQFFHDDIQKIAKREKFTIQLGNRLLQEEEIIEVLNQQHQYILYLTKEIKNN
jgi:glycosyltransferase involved in cell wall biosynthesis